MTPLTAASSGAKLGVNDNELLGALPLRTDRADPSSALGVGRIEPLQVSDGLLRSAKQDRHRDNAMVRADGRWGCALDSTHKRGIGEALGVLDEEPHFPRLSGLRGLSGRQGL